MRREFTVQKQLRPVYPYVPEVLALCDDPAVLGSDFYVMERIDGIILRGDLPEDSTLLAGRGRALAYRVFDRLIELHEVDPAAAGLADLGKGAGYVERQVRGWSDRYRKARTPDVARRRGDDGLAAREPAGRRTHLRDPQRLPLRQRGARRPSSTSSACSTGRWPRSATR